MQKSTRFVGVPPEITKALDEFLALGNKIVTMAPVTFQVYPGADEETINLFVVYEEPSSEKEEYP